MIPARELQKIRRAARTIVQSRREAGEDDDRIRREALTSAVEVIENAIRDLSKQESWLVEFVRIVDEEIAREQSPEWERN